jgi:hypothetical protein
MYLLVGFHVLEGFVDLGSKRVEEGRDGFQDVVVIVEFVVFFFLVGVVLLDSVLGNVEDREQCLNVREGFLPEISWHVSDLELLREINADGN